MSCAAVASSAGTDASSRCARPAVGASVTGGDRELAVLDGKGWGSRPVKVTVVVEPDAVEPGLLLFAAFVVRGLARDADGSAGGGAAVIASSSGT